MKSTLDIYKTELTPAKNAIIEDIDEYLDTKAIHMFTITPFQYQKIALTLTITIAEKQEYVGKSIGNYCTIKQDNRTYYYFIMSSEWTSQNAITLSLALDTLNTYAKDLQFSPKTAIQRSHIDRYKAKPNQDKLPGSKQLNKLVDRQPEGLNLEKEKTYHQYIIPDNATDIDWFLMYKTRDNLTPDNNANPVEIRLIPEKPLLIDARSGTRGTQRVYPNQLTNGYFYFLSTVNNPGASFKTINDRFDLKDNEIASFTLNGDKIKVSVYNYNKVGTSYSYNLTSKTIPDCIWVDFIQSTTLKRAQFDLKNYTDINNLRSEETIIAGKQENIYSVSYKNIDKTDSRLMKVIRCPYCPVKYTKKSNGEISLPEEWRIVNGYWTLKEGYQPNFINKIDDFDITKYITKEAWVRPSDGRDISLETKLLNSEFFTFKFAYDSFAREIQFERFDLDSYEVGNVKVPIEFKTTNTINSNFAFRINPSNNLRYARDNDYDDYMIVKRNNEETLLNNDYINYIRNGYNYDKKNIERGKNLGYISAALGGVQSVAHLGIPFGMGAYKGYHEAIPSMDLNHPDLTPHQLRIINSGKQGIKNLGGASLASTAGISAGINAITGAINTAVQYQNAKLAQEQKLQELSMQATKVSGSDDVDLLKYYNDNRLNLITYDTEPLAKKAAANLFYYTGYSHPVQEKPNTKSRYWFNYIQCEPIFINQETAIYNDFLDEIRARYGLGVTVYHHHPEIQGGWDFEQTKENWETSILDTSTLPTSKLEPGFKLGYIINSDSNVTLKFRDTTPVGDGQVIIIQYYDTKGEVQVAFSLDFADIQLSDCNYSKGIEAFRYNQWNDEFSSRIVKATEIVETSLEPPYYILKKFAYTDLSLVDVHTDFVDNAGFEWNIMSIGNKKLVYTNTSTGISMDVDLYKDEAQRVIKINKWPTDPAELDRFEWWLGIYGTLVE